MLFNKTCVYMLICTYMFIIFSLNQLPQKNVSTLFAQNQEMRIQTVEMKTLIYIK